MLDDKNLIKELSKINEQFIKQYVYLKSNNGRHFKDWDEVLAQLSNKDDVTKKDIIKGIDFAIGITDNEKIYNKYLPATKENVDKLKNKPIIEEFYDNIINDKFQKGDDVKVFGRVGKIVKVRGDVVDIEFPADDQNMARSDSYYKQDVQKV